jgi:hypothetical protein
MSEEFYKALARLLLETPKTREILLGRKEDEEDGKREPENSASTSGQGN